MGDIRDRVAVVGTGCAKFGENYDMSIEDMIVAAGFEALEDAGVAPGDIQAAWVGTLNSAFSGTSLGDALKIQNIPITRVENYCASGMDAFRNACFAVASGAYDVALVVGFEKLRDSGARGIPNTRNHPMLAWGVTAPNLFALAANRHFHKYGTTKSQLAKVAVKNHHNGAMNKKAHFQMEIDEETVLNAPLISSPLGLFDCCPTTDGAAAAVICRTDIAKSFRDDYVLVKGLGLAVTSGAPYFKPGFEYDGFPATTLAARQAYEQAGIKNPLEEIDLAETHDCFTITEILNYEDLLFCEKGKGGRFIEEGHSAIGGKLPVNPSGGLKSSGHPIGGTGVRMIYEVTRQLQHRVGDRQVKDAQVGLAHNLGGPGAVGCVTILGNP
ncbi:MAG: acetyl-CoA acetyltransferase [Deltaproteobacteria bacterium]|nr:acetyl-CoA acetyltransferase [Deltaproteobacteria bacterium]